MIPKKILIDFGLEEKKDYKSVFLGAHDAVAIAVNNGNIAAGGLSHPIYKLLITNNIIDKEKINEIIISKDYPQYPWVYINELDDTLKKNIQKAFIDLKDNEILKQFDSTSFKPIDDSNYDIIRKLSNKLSIYNFQ